MGFPNIDFAVRESLAVIDGDVVIFRFGTCGSPNPSTSLGNLALAKDCRAIYRNPDAFRRRGTNGKTLSTPEERYIITQPVSGDQ